MSGDKTIFRVAKRRRPYTQVCNAMLRDPGLSLEGRGALAFILSHPDDWQFSQQWFQKTAGIGRDKAVRILKEIVTAGYATRERNRNPDGTHGAYEYVFTDEPNAKPEPEKTPEPMPDEGPSDNADRTGDQCGFPVTGEPVRQTRNSYTNNGRNEDCNEKTVLLGAHEPVNFALLSHQLTEAAGDALDNPVNCMGLLNLSIPQMWLNSGADLELDILPTLRAASVRHRGKRIRDWKYFSGMISDAMAARMAGMPTAQGPPAERQRPPTKAEEKIAKTREFNAQMDRYFSGGKS